MKHGFFPTHSFPPGAALCLAYLLFVLGVPGTVSRAATLDRTVARLNQDIITESDISEEIAEESGILRPQSIDAFSVATTQTVGTLLDKMLLIQEAKRLKIDPPDDTMHDQVEDSVSQIRSHFTSEKEFREGLAEEHLNIDDLRKEFLKRARSDYRVFHVVGMRFSVSREEVLAFEKECEATGQNFTSYRLKRLGIPITKKQDKAAACAKARAIVARIITEGISFDEGVRKYGEVPGCREDGGDMGNLSTDKLAPAIRDAVEKIDPGQATPPIVAGGFANIFYLDSRRGPKSLLTQKKFARAKDSLLKDLRRKASLQIYDPRFRELLPEEYRSVDSAPGEDKPSRAEPATGRSLLSPEKDPAASPTRPSEPKLTPAPYPRYRPSPTPVPRRNGSFFNLFRRR